MTLIPENLKSIWLWLLTSLHEPMSHSHQQRPEHWMKLPHPRRWTVAGGPVEETYHQLCLTLQEGLAVGLWAGDMRPLSATLSTRQPQEQVLTQLVKVLQGTTLVRKSTLRAGGRGQERLEGPDDRPGTQPRKEGSMGEEEEERAPA